MVILVLTIPAVCDEKTHKTIKSFGWGKYCYLLWEPGTLLENLWFWTRPTLCQLLSQYVQPLSNSLQLRWINHGNYIGNNNNISWSISITDPVSENNVVNARQHVLQVDQLLPILLHEFTILITILHKNNRKSKWH